MWLVLSLEEDSAFKGPFFPQFGWQSILEWWCYEFGVKFQNSLVRVEDERDKLDTEFMKQKEKVDMTQAQIQRAQNDRENLQSEMEILLDRINKLSELLDKARVSSL